MNAEYSSLKDMIDGGGAGQTGEEFGGGGVLSDIANSLGIRPLGWKARDAEEAREVMEEVRTVLSTSNPKPAKPNLTPPPVTVTRLPAANASYASRTDPYDPRGRLQDPNLRPNIPMDNDQFLAFLGGAVNN